MTDKLLSIRNLSVKYKLRDYTINALEDISLDLNTGSSLGVAGETGSGKSTLALAIMKLLPKYEGMYTTAIAIIIFNKPAPNRAAIAIASIKPGKA